VISVARAFQFARLATRSFYDLVDAANRGAWEWEEMVQVSQEAREDSGFLPDDTGFLQWGPGLEASVGGAGEDGRVKHWLGCGVPESAGGQRQGEAPC
jgi:hypothetical protein